MRSALVRRRATYTIVVKVERAQTVELIEGANRLAVVRYEVIANGHPALAAELRVDGRPIVSEHADNEGSIGIIYEYAHLANLDDEVAFVRRAVAERVAFAGDLHEPIATLLGLFAPGTYRLALGTMHPQCGLVDVEVTGPWNGRGGNLYPDPENLFPTRSVESLDEATIDAWRARLRAGERPIAILVRLDEFSFAVLDGHHKLCAYGREKLEAHALTIEPVATAR